MRLLFIESAEKCPHRQGDREREHYVWNQNSREKKNSDTSAHAQSGAQARAFAESPHPKSRGKPGKRQDGKHDGNPRRPVVNGQNPVTNRDGPINKWRLFEVRNSVEASRNPIAGSQHVPRDLRLNRIDVIHQGWWRFAEAQVDGSREDQNGQVYAPTLACKKVPGVADDDA